MFYPRRIFVALCALASLCAGCNFGGDSVVEVTAQAVSTSPPAAVVAPTKSEMKTPSTPDLANPSQTAAPTVAFTPPFPDRLELFEAPKRAQGKVKRDDEHGATVELKGFVNVDQPRVVLSIDGVVAPVPEGGEKYGVRVISIQPPSVVLQRGRNRWTATLE